MENESTNEEVRAIIALRLKALRQDTRRTQADTARAIGINPKTLSSLERGHHLPNLLLARTLCQYYNAPLDFLFTGRGLNRKLTTKLGTMAQRSLPVV